MCVHTETTLDLSLEGLSDQQTGQPRRCTQVLVVAHRISHGLPLNNKSKHCRWVCEFVFIIGPAFSLTTYGGHVSSTETESSLLTDIGSIRFKPSGPLPPPHVCFEEPRM